MATAWKFLGSLLIATMATYASAADNQALFAPFQTLLERHLVAQPLPAGGLTTAFDYKQALQASDTIALLRKQTDALANADPSSLEGKAQAVAFWINAYNFFMIHQILTDQPDGELVSSVWDYGGRVNPFKEHIFQRPLFNIGGDRYSLDQIEKDVLLGDEFQQRGWKEARVHFAVNCASVGCPPLRQAVYSEHNLESLLTENTRLALNTPRHLTVDSDTLKLSALFDWYQDDFAQEAGSARQFIQRWAASDVADRASQTNAIEYINYDWALNRPEHFPELNQ